jgi:hypothetical protein
MSVKIYNSAIPNKWLVSEGRDMLGSGGRIIGQFDSLKDAKKRAKQRKEVVGDKEAVFIEKLLFVASIENNSKKKMEKLV